MQIAAIPVPKGKISVWEKVNMFLQLKGMMINPLWEGNLS
jgi:hypothetical protein